MKTNKITNNWNPFWIWVLLLPKNASENVRKKQHLSRNVNNHHVCCRHHGRTLWLRYPLIPHEALPGICCLKQQMMWQGDAPHLKLPVTVPAILRERGDVHRHGLTAQVFNIGMLHPACFSSSSTTTIYNSRPPFSLSSLIHPKCRSPALLLGWQQPAVNIYSSKSQPHQDCRDRRLRFCPKESAFI